ncbi:MAG: 4-phosphoerythronate dehydrogenase [Gammaproteobacteria bacterium]|nr:4-phosphoerythronate dehydrogenase [Gammaproteobacteria bacterium]
MDVALWGILLLTIVIDDAVVEAERLFGALGKTIIVPGRDITQNAQKADALIIRSRTHISAQFLQQHSNIRFIGSTVVGLDHIDQTACTQAGVTLYTAQGCNARSVAEYVIVQIVAYALQQQRELSSLTLGIIGVGNVGKQLQQLANLLGIKLILNDPYRQQAESDFPHTALTKLLAQSDIISLHTPLTQKGEYPTFNLINRDTLAHIRANTLFINAARGDVVDESALIQRDDLHLITDCWSHEPHICNSLLAKSQLATPHIAGHAWDAKYRGGFMAAQALAHWSEQQPPNYAPNLSEHSSIFAAGNTPLEQLNSILQQAYAFFLDDQILRNTPEAERAHTFEHYRRHYPLRREWTELSLINQSLTEKTYLWASGLGFKL